MSLDLAPCTLEEANEFVRRHHRHHQPTPVAKFSIAAVDDGSVVGVVIVGLPKARMAMDGWTLEVTRLASDGRKNVCSLLYGAARRAAFALGYRRVLTYTLAEENGASLRASGFTLEAEIEGESWMRRSENGGRFVDDRNPIGDKKRWSAGTRCALPVPRVELEAVLSLLPAGGLCLALGDRLDLSEVLAMTIDTGIVPYERIKSAAIVKAITLQEGERLLVLQPFGWHIDGHHIPNAAEHFSREGICELHGWDVVCDFGPWIAVVTTSGK